MINAPQYGIVNGSRVALRGCRGKVRHETKDSADAAVLLSASTYPLRVYGCEICGGWHLTKQVAR